ncbi:MAG TPA: hypothetical protein VFS59_07795 [Gemmatimonadaceae bacterium]|nr:hypothetical protein [Gemmatimonadaceae bacterium]
MTDNRPDDDILDERIRALTAARYNAPEGSVPRDAMWAQIAAARRAARAATAAEAAAREVDVVPLAPRRRSRAAVAGWSALLAAGLVLGVLLEREVFNEGPEQAVAVVPPRADSGPAAASPETARADGAPGAARRDVVAPPSAPAGRVRDGAPGAPQSYAQAEPRDLPALGDSTVQTFYRTAAVQTLVQAEALLIAYRGAEGTTRDPRALRDAARWARDVLSSTRLLMDSPAGRDPQLRMLFTDLELILAQIVQLSGTPLQANERELIDRAMRDRDLLPRLRSAVPAGLAAS